MSYMQAVNNSVKIENFEMSINASSPEKIWSAAQNMLRTIVNADIFNLWFAPLRGKELNGDYLTVEVANDFCELWLKDNYGGLMQDAITHAAGRPLKIKFHVGGQLPVAAPL